MFSGIIKELGKVESLQESEGIIDLSLSTSTGNTSTQLGDSIAINGCCLTVTKIQDSNKITFQITKESLDKTNFKNLQVGMNVNLEPALRMGDRLDGHLVSGHVDSIGEVVSVDLDGENTIITIKHSNPLSKYIASKGSICVNGVSLTVIDAENSEFSFTLIPYTRDNTNLGLLKPGDLVNLEIDLVSRYLVNYLEKSESNVAVECK